MNRNSDSENGWKIIAAVLHNTWRRNKWAEKNLPPGWVLQGKSEQGMPSLSLLPENAELATASCASNLYPNHIWRSSKCSTYETLILDKHGLDVSKMTRLFVLRIIQTALQMILIFNYVSFYCKISDNCNWWSFQGRALWVRYPSHSRLQFTKIPNDLVHDK